MVSFVSRDVLSDIDTHHMNNTYAAVSPCGRFDASWEIFPASLSSADFFQNQPFLKNSFRNAIRVSNSLDPDYSFRPDLGPNCLPTLSADDIRR